MLHDKQNEQKLAAVRETLRRLQRISANDDDARPSIAPRSTEPTPPSALMSLAVLDEKRRRSADSRGLEPPPFPPPQPNVVSAAQPQDFSIDGPGPRLLNLKYVVVGVLSVAAILCGAYVNWPTDRAEPNMPRAEGTIADAPVSPAMTSFSKTALDVEPAAASGGPTGDATLTDENTIDQDAVSLTRRAAATPATPPVVETATTALSVAALSPRSVVDHADELMRSGRVAAAREHLFAHAAPPSIEISWALARAHDPRVIAEIRVPDKSPDAVLAAHWYKTWHKLAVEQGHVSDAMSIERLLRSLD